MILTLIQGGDYKEKVLMFRDIGTIGEHRAIVDLLSTGCKVFRPVVDSGYDLLIEYKERFYKVECKTSSAERYTGSIAFGVSRTQHSNSKIVSVPYGDDIDFFYLWSPLYPERGCLIPRSLIKGKVFSIRFIDKSYKFQNIHTDFTCEKTLQQLESEQTNQEETNHEKID